MRHICNKSLLRTHCWPREGLVGGAAVGSRRRWSTGASLLSIDSSTSPSYFRQDYHASALTFESDQQQQHRVRVHNFLPGVSNGAVAPMDYATSWTWQHVLLSQRLAARRQRQEQTLTEMNDEEKDNSDKDCILLLEHAPVYTLGRGADEGHLTFLQQSGHDEVSAKLSRKARGPNSARLAVDRTLEDKTQRVLSESKSSSSHRPSRSTIDTLAQEVASPVLAPNGVPIYRVDRGGEVTFHGPSQLVVYPMLDLKGSNSALSPDLHRYLRLIEEVVIRTLAHYGIDGTRDTDNTGVWVGDEKVAAVGISASKWITTHGLALNVDPDLSYFDTSVILPCGIEEKGVTSIAQVLRQNDRDADSIPNLVDVAEVLLEQFQVVFGVELDMPSPLRSP